MPKKTAAPEKKKRADYPRSFRFDRETLDLIAWLGKTLPDRFGRDSKGTDVIRVAVRALAATHGYEKT